MVEVQQSNTEPEKPLLPVIMDKLEKNSTTFRSQV